ncbi:MAG: patatin-like phospholipase family protein [Candidatus Omnitrophota bacterium]
MKDVCRVVSIYSNVSLDGRMEYSVNLAASIAKVTEKKVAFIDDTGQIKDISQEAGIELLKPLEADQDILEAYKKVYDYIVINMSDRPREVLYDVLSSSDSLHFFVGSTADNLKDARVFLEDLIKNGQEEIIKRAKIVIYRLDVFDKLSEEEMSWLLKKDIWAMVPEPGLLDPLIGAGGIPAVLRSSFTPYSIAVLRIAKKETGKLLGLALGSGAAFGLAHIGVLKVIEESRIPIDIISGSSIGALIASMWGLGLPSEKIEQFAKGLKDKLNVMRLLDFTIPISGILAGSRLKIFLRDILGEKMFEDLKIPVKIIVYDLANRETIIMDKGPLLDAVFMSIAVPGIFAPQVKKDRVFIDGGVSDPVPVDILLKNGVNKIIAVNVLPGPEDIYRRNMAVKKRLKEEECQMHNGPFYIKIALMVKRFFRKIFTPNIFDVIMTSMQSMEYMLAENSCRKASLTLHPVFADATSIDFHLAKSFIEKGREEAILYIKEIKRLASQ